MGHGAVGAEIVASPQVDAITFEIRFDRGHLHDVPQTRRHFKANVQAGMVMVNMPTAGVDYHVPFGGRKASSYGPREQGAYAKEFFTVVKTAYTSSGAG
jgi:acyl-CoA reductase-like NAD-dependent aldehyde dehydrogenase